MKPEQKASARTWFGGLLFLAGGIGFGVGYLLNVTFAFPAVSFDVRILALLFLLGAGGGAFWGGLAWLVTKRPWLGIVFSGLLGLGAGLSLLWLSRD